MNERKNHPRNKTEFIQFADGFSLSRAMGREIPEMEHFRRSAFRMSSRITIKEEDTPQSHSSASQKNSVVLQRNSKSRKNSLASNHLMVQEEGEASRKSSDSKERTTNKKTKTWSNFNSLFEEIHHQPEKKRQSLLPSLPMIVDHPQPRIISAQGETKKQNFVQKLTGIFKKKSGKNWDQPKNNTIEILNEVKEDLEEGNFNEQDSPTKVQKPKRKSQNQEENEGSLEEPEHNFKSELQNVFQDGGQKRVSRKISGDGFVYKRENSKEAQINLNYKRMKRYKNQIEKGYLKLREKSKFEKLKEYEDEYPLLKFRKGLMWVKTSVSQACLLIITNPLFEAISLCTITINSIFLAFERFDAETPAFVDNSEYYFLLIYTIEMFSNIFGMGFVVNQGSYLRDPW